MLTCTTADSVSSYQNTFVQDVAYNISYDIFADTQQNAYQALTTQDRINIVEAEMSRRATSLSYGLSIACGRALGYVDSNESAVSSSYSRFFSHIDYFFKISMDKMSDVVNGYSELHRAILNHDQEKTQRSIKSSVDLKQEDYNHDLPIHLAIKHQNHFALKAIIKAGIDLSVKHYVNGYSLLHLAIKANNHYAIRLLIQHGINVNATDSEGVTPLMLLARQGDVAHINLLLSYGADLHHQDNDGNTVLHSACFSLNDEVIEYLIKKGSNLDAINDYGSSPKKLIYRFASYNNQMKIIADKLFNTALEHQPQLLRSSDFKVYKFKNEGISRGAFYEDSRQVKWLLKDGHYGSISIVNEYVAGGIFQLLLGENVPQVELVIDDTNKSLLVASKLIAEFKNLNQIYGDGWVYGMSYPSEFPTSLNGKPITNFLKTLCAIQFVRDSDAHCGNTGLINRGNHFSFAKVDHGFAFSFVSTDNFSFLDLREHLREFYRMDSALDYNATHEAIAKIALVDFIQIENVITSKVAKAKNYMFTIAEYAFSDGWLNEISIDEYRDKLITFLKNQHTSFKNTLKFMELEKAIIEQDDILVSNLIKKGVDIDVPFSPFFDSLHQKSRVTGRELMKEYLPFTYYAEENTLNNAKNASI